MNRNHTCDKYLDIIKTLKIARDDLEFTSDFIVGYPGETDNDFQDTLNLIKEVNYAQSFSFKYSPRPGTPASNIKEQVSEEIKSHRLCQLQELLNHQQYEFNKKFINQKVPVLFERKRENQLIGKTPYLQSVVLEKSQ